MWYRDHFVKGTGKRFGSRRTLSRSKATVLIIFFVALFVAVNYCSAQDITGRIVGTRHRFFGRCGPRRRGDHRE